MDQHVHYRPNVRRDSITIWIVTFVCFALLYGLTCQRSWAWQDSGIFQLRISRCDITGWLGLALAHPLFILFGQWSRLLPAGAQAWGMNFTAALGAAVAVANVAGIVRRLTGKRWVALATAGMLGVCHTLWWLATITETYTWAVAFLTAEVWLLIALVQKPTTGKLAALALVNGLAWCMHNLALLALPVYLMVAVGLAARKHLPLIALGIAFVAWIVGAGLYLWMIADLATSIGLLPAVKQALVGGYAEDVFNVTPTGQWVKFNLALIAMNFISALTAFACVGLFRASKRLGTPLATALIAIAAIDFLFVIRYTVADQFMFALPALVMVAILGGVGLASLAEGKPWVRAVAIIACLASLIAGPAADIVAASVASTKGYGYESRRPFRHEARYWLVPWKCGEDSAALFAAAALAEAGPDGVIFADNTAQPVLLLTQSQATENNNVTVQYAGKPLPRFADDPQGFFAELGDRPIFAVTPGAVDPGLVPYVTIEPPAEKQVLFRVWTTP